MTGQHFVRPFLGGRYQQHPWGPPGPPRWYSPGWSGAPIIYAPSWSTPIVQTLPPAHMSAAQVEGVLRSARQWLTGRRVGCGRGVCLRAIAAAYPGFDVVVYEIGPLVGLRRIPEVYVGNRLRLLVNGNGVVIRVSLG